MDTATWSRSSRGEPPVSRAAAKKRKVLGSAAFTCSGFTSAPFIYRAAETVHCHTLKTWVHSFRPSPGSRAGSCTPPTPQVSFIPAFERAALN